MADPVFFPAAAPLSIAEIVSLTGAGTVDGARLEKLISGAAALDRAGPDDVAFFANRRFADDLRGTRAGACFCRAEDAKRLPGDVQALVVKQPQYAFATVAARLYPTALRPTAIFGGSGISPFAHVHPQARIEGGATIEPGAVVGPGAEVGAGALIGPGAIIGPEVRIGRETAVGANAVLANALVGNRVIIHPSVSIGQDGFGFLPGRDGHRKIVQIGRVIIQDGVEIGASTTIDRGSNRDTIIGEGTKIDNQVQIGHNTIIGRHCLIAGKVGISGTVTIGDFVSIGGGAGLRDNISVGDGVQIAAAAAVSRNVPAGQIWAGYPAGPIGTWRREIVAVRQLGRRLQSASGGRAEENGPDE